MAVVFSAAAAYPRPQGRAGLRSGHPDRHHRRGHGHRCWASSNMLGQNVIIQSIGASSGVIVAGAIFTLPALYILGLDAAFLPDVPLVAVRRPAGHRAADPLPQIFRQGDARQISLPRGHGDHRGPRFGREGRLAGQTAGRRGTRGRIVRLRRRYVRTVDRVGLDAHLRMGRCRRRQVQGGLRAQYLGRRAGSGLYHRPEIRHDHHRRIVPRLVRDRPGDRLAGRSGRSRRDALAAGRHTRRHRRRPAVDLHRRKPLRLHRQADRHRRHRHGRASSASSVSRRSSARP